MNHEKPATPMGKQQAFFMPYVVRLQFSTIFAR